MQHRVYILHVLRIKDKQKKLSSKCYEKLSTWLKCHNFFATPWKFLILSNMYWGQTKRFKKWKKTDFVFCNLLLVRLCWIYNFPAFLFFCFFLFQEITLIAADYHFVICKVFLYKFCPFTLFLNLFFGQLGSRHRCMGTKQRRCMQHFMNQIVISAHILSTKQLIK